MAPKDVIVAGGFNKGIYSDLFEQMYQDRAEQFVGEYGWDLSVDSNGCEKDQYDVPYATYLILTDQAGRHLGSTRLLPSTMPNMTSQIFHDFVGGHHLNKPEIWESTRFFVSRRSTNRGRDAIRLMRAGLSFARASGIQSYVGVSAKKTLPLFAACGWRPTVLEQSTYQGLDICGCLWEVGGFERRSVSRVAA